MQLLLVWLLVGFATPASSATDSAASVSAKQVPPAPQTDEDDDEDDWIFDSAPYTDNPQTGQRVEQYAPEKPDYLYTPRGYLMTPHYYSGDPFFLPNTDMMFFQNNPDPFYAEPLELPNFYDGQFGTSDNFYGFGTGGDVPAPGKSN